MEVKFQYDEHAAWQPVVTGVKTPEEAQQAFAAVVATCYHVDPRLQCKAKVEKLPHGGFLVTPAV